mmetsp:Transcript_9161/g.13297  ORF Transcript_9161/g.13297 Transcript_9161/m.13297 type:complete len:220 (-) Transcript_9161:99-758(-)|eukprot:CAMPEP_0195536184 /NCGR_PEP_ID=MMETSP0794_2-20130614/45620_1 /TAXON_ID=515487 /ORGANISM="Stephanopyxis turris, Strain CCMP 815" /LENGTH=219 /DNA_ID=CAMNT_0040669519 /DNA_START=20 /DNA_END=679 /DNA_ORIENTATION=+
MQPPFNYDVDPTDLYKALETERWDFVIENLEQGDFIDQAQTWVYRKEEGAHKIKWQILPIHAAIGFEAPKRVIKALLDAYPNGAKEKDDSGMLPLHWAYGKDAEEEVLSLLTHMYPKAVATRDNKGRMPLEHAVANKGNKSVRRWTEYIFFDRHLIVEACEQQLLEEKAKIDSELDALRQENREWISENEKLKKMVEELEESTLTDKTYKNTEVELELY